MKIKIDTLTPVHVGSGEMLYRNNDFCVGKDSEGYTVIGIADHHKILDMIGKEHLDNWVLAIERGESFEKVVKQYKPKAQLDEYTYRVIECEPNSCATLKELIHDGMGRPYIPGSSIKGAIRTAIFATLMNSEEHIDTLLLRQGKLTSAKELENQCFGIINEDIFRFLLVGDAIFGDLNTAAYLMVNINERPSGNFWDVSKTQLIEAINFEDTSHFSLRFNKTGYALAKKNDAVHALPPCMSTIEELFKTINAHTLELVKADIKYWEDRESMDSSEKVELYVNELYRLQRSINSCAEGKSCVLRIGHGSGWNFITGGWARRSASFQDRVVPQARPQNFKYREFDFPKTRRIAIDSGSNLPKSNATWCLPLGFVKLTHED